MRCHVDVQPCQIQAGSVVHGDGAEEGTEELYAIGNGAKDQNVSNDAKNICEGDEGAADGVFVGNKGESQERDATKDIDRNGKVLCLKGCIAH